MKWFRLDRLDGEQQIWLDSSVQEQYLYMLALCTLEATAFHLGTRSCIHHFLNLKLAKANMISMSLILASFGKILMFCMVVWEYTFDPELLINIYILISQYVALSGTFLLI